MKKPLRLTFAALVWLTGLASAQFPEQKSISGPLGSGLFGSNVTVLPNGNFVVTDPGFDLSNPTVSNVGAVHLYNRDGLLISTLRGSTANDAVGDGGVTVLPNGNFVVRSFNWNQGAATDAGAVTWGSATTGFIGGPVATVSPGNSLVGASTDDGFPMFITPLVNGNYVVTFSVWDNGPATNAGAVAWGDGATGAKGVVSAANSLVGSTTGDQVGRFGVIPLTNGNYVVRNILWDNGGIVNRGAVTWGNGLSGITGPVSTANSLVGSTAQDSVGGTEVQALTNGNYVVVSKDWDNGATANVGAVTWCDGTTGRTGPVSPSNSLVGTTAQDRIGSAGDELNPFTGVTALANGHYVVVSTVWRNEGVANAGAVTWGNGFTGETTGPVTPTNSLVGTSTNDGVGSSGVTVLTNGNYVVSSPGWDDGAVENTGAVTWANGTAGLSGPVSRANSLFGTTTNDFVGFTTQGLTNGNYAVESRLWDNGSVVDAGAVTWGNGSKGITGPVSPANSLVGSSTNDQVGRRNNPTDETAVIALTNGNYLVCSDVWDHEGIVDRGAATWGDGSKGTRGPVTPANSLIGPSAGDRVGSGALPLTNGNYVVLSPSWKNSGINNAGAATWGDGFKGTRGIVSPANSLVGTTTSEFVGGNAHALANGNYVLGTTGWDRRLHYQLAVSRRCRHFLDQRGRCHARQWRDGDHWARVHRQLGARLPVLHRRPDRRRLRPGAPPDDRRAAFPQSGHPLPR